MSGASTGRRQRWLPKTPDPISLEIGWVYHMARLLILKGLLPPSIWDNEKCKGGMETWLSSGEWLLHNFEDKGLGPNIHITNWASCQFPCQVEARSWLALCWGASSVAERTRASDGERNTASKGERGRPSVSHHIFMVTQKSPWFDQECVCLSLCPWSLASFSSFNFD